MLIFKYKISIGTTFLSGCFLLLSISALLIILLILLRDYSTLPTIGIIGMVTAWLFFFIMMLSMYSNFRTDLSDFRENRRNQTITIEENSIILPFEKNNQPIKILFKDIHECKESYISLKKKKKFFIYISSKQDKNEDYRLYKENMNTLEYDQLRNNLLTKTKK